MATRLVGMQTTEAYLKTQMEGIPHYIDLDIPGLTQGRLLGLLESLQEEDDADDVCEEETVFKLNFMSWVYMKLADSVRAKAINDRVIAMTGEENVMSVGNCVFLRWKSGKQEEALSYNTKLQAMKRLPSYQDRIATAKAELAYSYSRVGGPVNQFKAICLFEEVIGSSASTLYWKLRLGLSYRRCTHLNLYTGMPEGRTLMECVEHAARHLTDVYRHASDNKLRGPALSELAVLCRSAMYIVSRNDIGRIFGTRSPDQMCKEALEDGDANTWVLTNCGKLFRSLKQVDAAVDVLKRSLRVREHTTTHHQLGLCYVWMAEDKTRRQNPRARQGPVRGAPRARGRQSFPVRPRDYRYPPTDAPLITLPNEFYNLAEKHYLAAIEMSHDENLPAVYDLGHLYKLAGRYQDALNRFNQVVSIGGEGHLVTIINAYEQAGLCYLLMENNPEAEDKLTKAISLAVIVASTCPQLQDCATELWQSFRTMRDRLDTEQQSRSRDKKVIRLYELVKHHKSVVTFVEDLIRLSDSQLTDPEVIRAGLNGYLTLQKTEKAFSFLTMVSMRPDITNSRSWGTTEMIEIRRNVLLCTAESRLKLQSSDAKFVFQELFKLHYGQCTGRVSEDSVDIANDRDVLLFYDEEHDTEELSQISQTVQALQSVLSQVFGLDTSRNLQGCLKYGPMMALQLEEMRRYQVVVVVLGAETRSPDFKAMMAMIPKMRTTVSPTRMVLVIDACQETAEVPDIIKQYTCLRLQQVIGNWGAASREGFNSAQDVFRHFVGDNLLALMQLFRFLIGQN